ncbi:hypothetical protein HBI42_050200 [Parastagonospora nodorum]|nr:hypothetical protein HBH42_155700 [Parastagonospora nodorum]KAH5431362.1 hypothetical protein HBI32_059360 [Parastagonospora nodorum]KAH6267287.1 hypothetical protein HBI42_050200 [Parastagonospora nodorum]KAH6421280.1 hypothetical protein HBI08_078830 [Parastagonospora nodorum]
MAFLSNTQKTAKGVDDFQNPYLVLIWNLVACSAIHLVYIILLSSYAQRLNTPGNLFRPFPRLLQKA